jgi:hypothetical protein
MIIWGWRTLTRYGQSGHFHCPDCATERAYRIRKLQRFFTLYFIPIIPLKVVAEAVECQSCGSQWRTEILPPQPATAPARPVSA